jgi:hypothetical protein
MAAEALAGAFGGLSEALEAFLLDKQRRADRAEEAEFRQKQLDLQTRQVDIGEEGQQADLERLERAEDVSTADRLRSFLGPGATLTEEQAGTLGAGGIPVSEAPIVGPTRPGRDLGSRLTLPPDFFERREQEQRGFEATARGEASEDRARRIATAGRAEALEETRTPEDVEAAQQRDALARIAAQDRGPQLSPEDLEKARTLETLFKLLQQETDLDRKEAVANRISEFLSDNPALAGIFDDAEGGDEAETSALLQGEPTAEGGFEMEDVLNRLSKALGITTATPGQSQSQSLGTRITSDDQESLMQQLLSGFGPGVRQLPGRDINIDEILDRIRRFSSGPPQAQGIR